jgi:hypothetical protein
MKASWDVFRRRRSGVRPRQARSRPAFAVSSLDLIRVDAASIRFAP